jgi:hypothetical protein
MNKDSYNNLLVFVILIIVIVFVLTIFSGCQENSTELVSHNTRKTTGFCNCYGSYRNEEILEVYGTIRNVANRNIDKVTIKVIFLDKDNNELIQGTDTINYLGKNDTADFVVQYCKCHAYYNNYDHYTISIST